jgi:hypothetical protein
VDCPNVEDTPLPTRVIDVSNKVARNIDFTRVRTPEGIEKLVWTTPKCLFRTAKVHETLLGESVENCVT